MDTEYVFHKILLVDDSESNRVLVELYLEDYPYTLVGASNGSLALDRFESNRFDCVLMDVQMPEMSGYEVVERMRMIEAQKGVKETPVIFLTALDLSLCKNETSKINNSRLLAKPVRRVDLLKNLQEMISSSS